MCRHTLAVAFAALVTAPASSLTAQQSESISPAQDSSYERHLRDFDYLMGDWTFEAVGLEWGRFNGTWSAFRLPGGEVLDVYRTVAENGSAGYLTTTVRSFNADTRRWDIVGMETGSGLRNVGMARKIGSELHLEQRLDGDIWRIRYYDITADRFSWIADVSADDGRIWLEGFLRIEARRTGPAHEWNMLPDR